MKFLAKQITVTLIFASFLTLALFSLTFMIHGPDGRMAGGCPFSAMSQSICPQEAISFLNIPTKTSLTVLIIFLPLLFFASPTFTYFLFNFPPFNLSSPKIIRWLALHENSPNSF